jgi:hypothetical protein
MLALLFSAFAFAAPTVPTINDVNIYTGNFQLTKRVDGKFNFRVESFAGEGVEQNVGLGDLISRGVHYALSGVVECEFGTPLVSVFDCRADFTDSPRTLLVEQLESINGEVHLVKSRTVNVEYFKIDGTLRTTRYISGESTEAIVNTEVLDNALSISLEQRFQL